MNQQRRSFAYLLRLVAAVLFIIAVVLVALPAEMRGKDPRIVEWTVFLLAMGGVAALVALASLIVRESTAPPETSAALSRLAQQLMDMQQGLKDLHVMFDHLSSNSAAPLVESKDYTPQLQQLAAQVEEVRELSLLPDADRLLRVQIHRLHRKSTYLKDIFGLVAAHNWSKAERMLLVLEAENPGDNEVAKGRSYLDHSRRLFEEESIVRGSREVEELVSAASWDHALHRARLLVEGFPHSGDARTLLERVEQEHNTYRETTIQRMFEEIRHDIDRHIWRRALMHAERLLKLYPDHRLAEKVRDQHKTLQDNAEIEERQELEVRIQEFIRAGKLPDAIQLAEEMIRRFPLSPQAESLETLLPRLRELALSGEALPVEMRPPAPVSEAAAAALIEDSALDSSSANAE